jgi:hypothetical protein
MKIIIKEAKEEFKPGLGIGVIASQDMTYDLPEDYNLTGLGLYQFQMSVQRDQEKMLHKVFKFELEEVEDE